MLSCAHKVVVQAALSLVGSCSGWLNDQQDQLKMQGLPTIEGHSAHEEVGPSLSKMVNF